MGTGRINCEKTLIFLSVCIIFIVNELIPVYYLFLEVKQLELVIHSNGSNECKLVDSTSIQIKSSSFGIRQIWI